MNVVLISTYELGRQPLGLAAPLAHLRAAGCFARGLDLSVEPCDDGAVADADLIGISTPMHTALRLGVETARRVRRLNPRAHVVFYGLYAWLNASYLLQTWADSVIGGEVEERLVALVDELAKGPLATDWPRRSAGLGRPRYLVPDRAGLPALDRYARLEIDGMTRLVAAVEASRGCAHRCLHCPITPVYGGRLRIIPQEIVLADVRQAVELGAEHLTFADPDFFNAARHSMSVVRAIHEQCPDLTFDATIKVEHLLEHEALLPELRRLGCVFVLSAVESLSDGVLRALDKGHSALDVSAALSVCRRSGICLRPSLLPFTPWTTLEDYLELLEFVEEHELLGQIDAVQLAIRLLLPPGSSLLAGESIQPYLGELDAAGFSYRWCHPDPRMDLLAEQAAARVEAGALKGEPVSETFAAVRGLARRAAGLPPHVNAGGPAAPVAPSPRLSESWFCCAEPTSGQRALVTTGAAEAW